MEMILTLTILGFVLVTVGLVGMYVSATRRLNALTRALNSTNADVRTHGRDIKVLKERAAAQSDHITITHEYKSENAPHYPSKEGL